jgi:hypothetical protein
LLKLFNYGLSLRLGQLIPPVEDRNGEGRCCDDGIWNLLRLEVGVITPPIEADADG